MFRVFVFRVFGVFNRKQLQVLYLSSFFVEFVCGFFVSVEGGVFGKLVFFKELVGEVLLVLYQVYFRVVVVWQVRQEQFWFLISWVFLIQVLGCQERIFVIGSCFQFTFCKKNICYFQIIWNRECFFFGGQVVEAFLWSIQVWYFVFQQEGREWLERLEEFEKYFFFSDVLGNCCNRLVFSLFFLKWESVCRIYFEVFRRRECEGLCGIRNILCGIGNI